MTKSFFQICGRQVKVTYKVNGKEEYDQWSLAYSGCPQFLWAYLKPHSWLCAPGTVAFYQGIVLFPPSIHIFCAHTISTVWDAVSAFCLPGVILLLVLISFTLSKIVLLGVSYYSFLQNSYICNYFFLPLFD